MSQEARQMATLSSAQMAIHFAKLSREDKLETWNCLRADEKNRMISVMTVGDLKSAVLDEEMPPHLKVLAMDNYAVS